MYSLPLLRPTYIVFFLLNSKHIPIYEFAGPVYESTLFTANWVKFLYVSIEYIVTFAGKIYPHFFLNIPKTKTKNTQ